jgi:hypothetical protein
MPTLDKRIDAYIAKSAAFAQPILKHLRKLVHKACPDVVETIKWGMPSFDYKGPYCSMAAFKQHCSFGFWKGDLITQVVEGGSSGMSHFGRITSKQDPPTDKVILECLKQAKALNDEGVKLPARSKAKGNKALDVPADLQRALRANKKARKTFEGFSYSHRKEYVEWITEAKREETRARRLETAIEWLAEGKSKNWKYER